VQHQPSDYEFERLASELSHRALSDQREAAKDLRDRAGMLLAAASVIASFMGREALERDGLGLLTWLALAALTCSVLAALYVLLPKKRIGLADDHGMVFAHIEETHGDVIALHRHVARSAARGYRRNRFPLERLSIAYRIASVGLSADIILWLLQLTGG
jgi:hypothetical protein